MRHFLKRLVNATLVFAAAASLGAQANCISTASGKTVCPAPDSQCLSNRTGDIVCSTPGGGIVLDRYGEPVCGPGYCTKDVRGEVVCSSLARGAASTDRYGNGGCAGQCVAASGGSCVRPRAVN
jgi:hypothetical protein